MSGARKAIENELGGKGEATCDKENDEKIKNKCLAKTTTNLRNEIRKYIQYMKDHAIMGKFMGT